MAFGLRRYSPACRLHPASLLIRIPAAKSSLRVLSAYALQLGLTVSYSWRHHLCRAPFIPRVHQTCQAHERGCLSRSSHERNSSERVQVISRSRSIEHAAAETAALRFCIRQLWCSNKQVLFGRCVRTKRELRLGQPLLELSANSR